MTLARKLMLAALAASVLTVGCTKGYTSGIGAKLVGIAGGNQSAAAGSVLPTALKVERIDANGLPVSGASVSWAADNGGSVSQSSTTTDANGQSSVTWTLGSTKGSQHVTASSGGLSFTFTAAAN